MSGTILIVDDSLTVRMDLTEAFEAAGFRTISCGTVAEAREFLSLGTIDIAILDVLLPDGNGVELLKEARASRHAPAVLMLTTEAEIKDRIRGFQTGADEYVGKPYDTGYVVAKAREILRNRGSSIKKGTTVLVIDDSATFREELRSHFEMAGYIVLTATTGEEGLHTAAGQRPDAIVVDGVLPGIDGATVIRRIRLDAALRGIPCLLLTGSEDIGSELRALDAGADAFVRKEEDAAFILAKLEALLRSATAGSGLSNAASLLSPKTILAVDDSATYLHELAETLQGEGYDVIPVRSGEEALELLAIQPVDCILMDLVMPGLNGVDACRRIKSAAGLRDVPVVMLTSLEERSAMIQGLSAGADDYISKSSDFEVLKARVRAQLRRKQYEDENRRFREEIHRSEMEAAEARIAREVAETRAAFAEELERKNKELEAFSYSVSHDLQAPLRHIEGFSKILLEAYSVQLDATGQSYLHSVRSAAQRMGELINDLMLLSRVSSTELYRERIDLSSMVRNIAADLRRSSERVNVEIVIQDGLYVHADETLMKVALENLLGNAWKFTSKVPCARIEVGRTETADGVVFFVRDNGAGFNMAYAAQLFLPFRRLHSESDFPGTGIGLATVQRVIDRHGGRIWAESVINQGATFFFRLPEKPR